MNLAQEIDQLRRGHHFRFHVLVHATKVWDAEGQHFDWPSPDEQYPEFVTGHFSREEADDARAEYEQLALSAILDGDGTAPELVFAIRDTLS